LTLFAGPDTLRVNNEDTMPATQTRPTTPHFEVAYYDRSGAYAGSFYALDYHTAVRCGDMLILEGAKVTIYGKNGNARNGWYMRGAA